MVSVGKRLHDVYDKFRRYRTTELLFYVCCISFLCGDALAYSPYFEKSSFAQPFDPTGRLDILETTDATDLQALVRAKSFKNEIILFTFSNSGHWLEWGVNMYLQLEAIGFQHHVGLALREDCVTIHVQLPHSACVTHTLPGDHWAQERRGIDFLWIGRYALAANLTQLGVNVLVLDLDCIIRRDFYVDLHSPPHAGVSLIHMEEGWANGGLFYMQNCSLRGPALWTHTEVFRRADIIKKLTHSATGFSGTAMDQALVNDAITVAGIKNGSVNDWPGPYVTGSSHHDHAFWSTPLPDGSTRGQRSVRVEGQPWYDTWWRESSALEFAPGAFKLCGSCDTESAKLFYNQVMAPTLWRTMPLNVPADAEHESDREETFAAALRWTFANSEYEHYNWPIAAITHLVAASSDWGETNEWTHSGRRALLAAADAWKLAPTGRYVRLSRTIVDKTDLSTKDAVQGLMRRLFDAAFVLKRTPALFGFSCNSTWLKKRSSARLGVWDTRVVKHGDLCYPAPGGSQCWSDVYVYDFELTLKTVVPRTVHEFDDAFELETHKIVELRHLRAPDEKRDENLFSQCPKWFQGS